MKTKLSDKALILSIVISVLKQNCNYMCYQHQSGKRKGLATDCTDRAKPRWL